MLVNSTDLTSYFNSSATTRGVSLAPVTTFGNDDVVYLAGTEFGSFRLGGYFDGEASAVDETLQGVFGASNSALVTFGVNGVSAVGDPVSMVDAVETAYDVASPVDGAVTVSATGSANGGLRNGGVVLHGLEAETGTMNEASYDGAASSAFGGAAYLHVTAFTGTNCVVKVQHSANDSTWADLVTFATVTGATAQRVVVASTVNRYLRAAITAGAFTSVTFAVAFARNRR